MPTSAEVISIISLLGGGAGLAAVVGYIRDRRKLGSETRIAEQTENSRIGLVSVQELESKLGYLTRVMTVLEAHNLRLEGDLDQQYEMNTHLNARVRELMHRCDQLESIVRRLCIDAGLDADKYI